MFHKFACFLLVFCLSFIINVKQSAALNDAQRILFIQGCMDGAKSKQFEPILKEVVAANGWPPASVELHFRFNREVILNPLVIARLCEEVVTVFGQNKAFVDQVNQEVHQNGVSMTAISSMQYLVNRLFADGLQRVPSDQLKPYFEFTEAMFEKMPTDYCAAIWHQTANPSSTQVLLETQGFLPLEIQERYLILVKKSIYAAVINWPPVYKLDGADAAQIDDIFGNYLTAYSSQFANPRKLALMLNGLEQGNNNEYCDLGRFYYGALKSMPGRDGDRARKFFLVSLR